MSTLQSCNRLVPLYVASCRLENGANVSVAIVRFIKPAEPDSKGAFETRSPERDVDTHPIKPARWALRKEGVFEPYGRRSQRPSLAHNNPLRRDSRFDPVRNEVAICRSLSCIHERPDGSSWNPNCHLDGFALDDGDRTLWMKGGHEEAAHDPLRPSASSASVGISRMVRSASSYAFVTLRST